MTRLSVVAAAALAIAFGFGAPDHAWAQGNKTGFDSTSEQGNSGKPANENANPDNNGTQDTSGPHGQIKQGNTDCNNCTSRGPGNSQH